jgi:molybdopterin-guanine dinucleotide biosynthesis protein A
LLMIDCVILAGGTNSELEKLEGISNKALIKIGDKEMVRYVLEAFRSVEKIERIVLAGPVEQFESLKDDYSLELVPEESSILENLAAATRYLKTKKPLLIATADIPLITTEGTGDFLQKCYPYDLDFYYPIVRKEVCENSFPGVKRTFVKLEEGSFTGGNIFLVNSTIIEPNLPFLKQFIDSRKKPLKMVSMLGAGFLLSGLAGRLSIAQLEKRFSGLFNLKAKAIISDYPELGFDVDKPGDLELMRKYIADSNSGL